MDRIIEECRAANLADIDTLISALWWVVLEGHDHNYNIATCFLNSIDECLDIEACFDELTGWWPE